MLQKIESDLVISQFLFRYLNVCVSVLILSKKCFIKFKKYDEETFDLVGELTKNCNIDDINEDFIIQLKIDVEKDGSEEKELEIELKKD